MKLNFSFNNTVKIVGAFIVITLVVFAIKGVGIYNKAFRPNIEMEERESLLFYIHSGDSFDIVMNRLDSLDIVVEHDDLLWVANKKNYPASIKPGRYRIEHGMTNNELINMLRSGAQETVKVVVAGKIRSIDQLANRVAHYLEFEPQDISTLLYNEAFIDSLGFNKFTILGMFIPNTYYFYWNTPPEEFIYRMKKEYDKFWNSNRVTRARKINFEPNEVITMASIVVEETTHQHEMNRIAGVYINRLEKGMKLRADPTVKFAHQNFGMRRIWKKHLTIDSPYNTYKNYGLPPGPIAIPSIFAIEAVLDYEHHEYLYFCAREDFSGYHNFAKTHVRHIANAQKYRRALNERKIYK
ncbi:MAG: endolytic transglycosylase MltG [Bacteroidetes bacterium]|jgi:UPF0755 protein|nr:endolytic transglycosylase MltG [Bacteroidota bacterium]